jgi:magnesium chelatase family protein
VGNPASVISRGKHGIDAPEVVIEAHATEKGVDATTVVGLPETAVREAKDRIRSAITSNHFEFPTGRLAINLAPADLPKEGGRFDLGMALAVLASTGAIRAESVKRFEVVGELALTGEVRGVTGVISSVLGARGANRPIIVPNANAQEAALLSNATVYAVQSLAEACALTRNPSQFDPLVQVVPEPQGHSWDLTDVRGQEAAKRALSVAAAGGHHLLMIGPPGTGKTMLARRLAGLLPPLTPEEALEAVRVHSAGGTGDPTRWLTERPVREPHHTASTVAIIGGGAKLPQPGEISLAHHGILFLDELPEFDRRVLESLREPLESGYIELARARYRARYPSRFQLVAAMNPCPAGRACTPSDCICDIAQQRRYQTRLSGPLLDRIDLHVPVPAVPSETLLTPRPAPSPADDPRASIARARRAQLARAGMLNAAYGTREIETHCRLSAPERSLLTKAADRLKLSARACHRVLKVARTLADLVGETTIGRGELSEALSYRVLDRG